MTRVTVTLTDEQKDQIEKLAVYLTLEQIADFFGVCRNTLKRIRNDDPEIDALYLKGKAQGIGNVAKTLIQSAMNGNTQAAMFYLKTQGRWKEASDPTTIINNTPKSFNDFYAEKLNKDDRDS